MIIWNGWGFLVGVLGFGCLLLSEFTVEAAMKDDQYYQNHGWPMAVGFLASAILVWPLGLVLNRKRAERELLDTTTGELVVLRSGGGNSFFFIPMQHWGPLFGIIAGVCLLVKR
ncbi:MAG TPA: hypothetical protein VM165_18035 [Planctomycetaceae bacterium]|nr:hypothetical protein [Planctomycetaceae bacterium]